jgi:cytochrome oxidase Cu insertion factor (SCO1/SenC/PrrC family)
MPDATVAGAMSEPQFASLVDAIASDPDRRGQLTGLLRENHTIYAERGTAAIARMRGWILLAMARTGVSDAALVFVLEELDSGTDPYLVAAAARALRSSRRPHASFAPFVMGALANIRYRDEPVSFEAYGEYAVSASGTSPVRELLATLAWLGPQAHGVLPEVEALRAPAGGLPRKFGPDVERALQAIRDGDQGDNAGDDCCSMRPAGSIGVHARAPGAARPSRAIESMILEDQDGTKATFKAFFRGQPSIVVFFYTRCDNPMKCSLTIAKLARVQALLEARGLAGRIRTAAFTYDPAFDLPDRLRIYGQDRGVRMDAGHRLFRATEDNDALQEHFGLGVGFVGSLVNRHRIELYILDAGGRVAVSFEQLRWDEQEVVARAAGMLERSTG